MEFSELIRLRESVRSYDPDRPVSKDKLLKILEAGRLAPSAANRQPWKYVIIASNEMLVKVKACYDKEWFRDAPQLITVVGDENEAWICKYDNRGFIETDLAIALTHIILAAADEGVATCWISNFRPDAARNALGLKDHQHIYAISPLGYPRTDYKHKETKERKPLTAITEWI